MVCKDLLAGSCTRAACPYSHQINVCELCDVFCGAREVYIAHIKGKKHARRVLLDRQPITCQVCDMTMMNMEQYDEHASGRKHQQALANFDGVPPPPLRTVPFAHRLCDVCQVIVPQSGWAVHLQGQGHAAKLRFQSFRSVMEEATRSKHGVEVSHAEGLDFGFLELDSLRFSPVATITLQVELTTGDAIMLCEARVSSSVGSYAKYHQSNFLVREISCPRRLKYGQQTSFQLEFDPRRERGHYSDRLELVFEDTVLNQRFVIIRTLSAQVGVREDEELLKPLAPYVRAKRRSWVHREPEEAVPGVKPPALAAINWTVPLSIAKLPNSVVEVLVKGSQAEKIEAIKRTLLPQQLTADTYGRHWKTLLWVEEHQLGIDVQQFDLPETTMEKAGSYYYLSVPGLAEKRPSLLVGDSIRARRRDMDGKWYEGYVHFVERDRVKLRFSNAFSNLAGQRYDVRFSVSRLPLRRMHQGLESAFIQTRVLFPSGTANHVPSSYERAAIRPVNRLIADNLPQLLAVTAIANLKPGSPPFVIFGPPGTGKTITMVEAIRQVLLKDSSARILAYAPSNAAADLLVTRLSGLGKSTLFRLVAPSRSRDLVPANVRNFTCENDAGVFSVPPPEKLAAFKVVVSTCISASVPFGIGMPRGHFSHLFIDEAGQACEPEVMIAIKTMAGPNTNIILSGDPKQLGPIVRSSVAAELGLGTSYLDRLMEMPLYDENNGYGKTFVKLIKNFRSHPSILKFPNDTFYKSELESHADPVIINSLLRAGCLVKPGFPIVFHAIKGQDLREARSPSFFNPTQASLVKDYALELLGDQRLRLTEEHIGIIAPYNAQCGKIRQLLKGKSGIKVGSVEEFQGQERRVIIISTVRSSTEFVNFDLRHTLGFVGNARRFNVAVTRAQALLIIVGDPQVLSLDPLWRSFLSYIHVSGGWKGNIGIDWDPQEAIRPDGYDKERRDGAQQDLRDIVDRMRTMGLSNGDDDDEEEAQADRPWREEE